MSYPKKPNRLTTIDVEGQDKDLWKRFKVGFMKKIEDLMAFEVNPDNKRTLKEEIGTFASKAIEYGKAKLDKAGIENQALLAEIEYKYAQAQREYAEARKIHAEARKGEVEAEEAEFLLQLKKSRSLLRGLKALITTDTQGEELVLLSADMDAFLIMIEAIEEEFRKPVG